MYYIYQIQFPNGKVYIGQTKDLKRRILEHKRCKHNFPINKALKKYGIENCLIVIPYQTESEEMIDVMERFYISAFASNEVGYNVESGGSKNKQVSELTKNKIRTARLGKKRNPHSEETKLKISKSKLGKKLTAEHINNVRISKLGSKYNKKNKQDKGE